MLEYLKGRKIGNYKPEILVVNKRKIVNNLITPERPINYNSHRSYCNQCAEDPDLFCPYCLNTGHAFIEHPLGISRADLISGFDRKFLKEQDYVIDNSQKNLEDTGTIDSKVFTVPCIGCKRESDCTLWCPKKEERKLLETHYLKLGYDIVRINNKPSP